MASITAAVAAPVAFRSLMRTGIPCPSTSHPTHLQAGSQPSHRAFPFGVGCSHASEVALRPCVLGNTGRRSRAGGGDDGRARWLSSSRSASQPSAISSAHRASFVSRASKSRSSAAICRQSAGRARNLKFETRVSWEALSDGALAEPTTQRQLVKVGGRPPGPNDKPGCMDPKDVSPEPLSILLPENHKSTSSRSTGGRG